MKENKALFVRTHDKNTSEQLIAEDFQLIDDKNGWVFLNKACKGDFNFDELKIAFTNILHM